jgi:hypothetical protein
VDRTKQEGEKYTCESGIRGMAMQAGDQSVKWEDRFENRPREESKSDMENRRCSRRRMRPFMREVEGLPDWRGIAKSFQKYLAMNVLRINAASSCSQTRARGQVRDR